MPASLVIPKIAEVVDRLGMMLLRAVDYRVACA